MVTLVNKEDQFLGTMEKMAAHRKGELHRAFSVFLFNSQGEVLLQRRSQEKYHSPGLWTNSCCSHPQPGETVEEAAHRRMQEELSLDTDLTPLLTFHYKAVFPNGLIENELDHVLIGVTDEIPFPDPQEVEDHCYMKPEQIFDELSMRPWEFTVWFRIIFEKYGNHIQEAFSTVRV
ncbi:MAG: isopentenyl-diphosphate Delta-isomerase [Tannerellaceae bacterium]|nr:isopentenyl-diphosphate Delta-isomerase [Tannerellaceae bacterium]